MPQAIQQAGPVSVAAAGRVPQGGGPGRGDRMLLPLGIDRGTRLATGYDQGPHARRDIGGRQAGALLHQLPFIIIHGHPGGPVDKLREFQPVKHGQTLAGVKDKRNIRLGKLSGMLQHPFLAVRRDNAEFNPARGADIIPV